MNIHYQESTRLQGQAITQIFGGLGVQSLLRCIEIAEKSDQRNFHHKDGFFYLEENSVKRLMDLFADNGKSICHNRELVREKWIT